MSTCLSAKQTVLTESQSQKTKPRTRSVDNIQFDEKVKKFNVFILFYRQFIPEEPVGFHPKLAQNQTNLLWSQ